MIPKLARYPLLLAAALFCALAFALPAAAQPPDADYSEFYQALEPHGRWIEHPRWGYVWSPAAQREEGWRPYSRGQWVYTDEHGWYWESEEEWGWGPYHYGRWILDERHGWIWIPGREWGPAWVAWRYSDDHVGWAPLPPEAVWEPDSGELAFSYATYEEPRWASMWVFVPVAYIASPRVWRYCAPPTRNVYFIGRTRYVPAYTVVDRRVFHRGLDVSLVERYSRRPVPRVQVRLVDNPRDSAWRRGGDRALVRAYRPNLAPNPNRTPIAPRVVPDRVHVTPSGREGQPPNGRFGQGSPRTLPQSPEGSGTPRGRYEGPPRRAYGEPPGPSPRTLPERYQNPRLQSQPGGPDPGGPAGANVPRTGNAPDGPVRPRFQQSQPSGPPVRPPETQRVIPQRPAAVPQPPRQTPQVQSPPKQAAPVPQRPSTPKQVDKNRPEDKVR